MEVFGHDGKKYFWEVVDNHGIEAANNHGEIGLRGFDFNLFGKYEKGVGREESSQFPYLLILIKIWPGDWNNQLKRMNKKVYE